jgi:hypothetical protein
MFHFGSVAEHDVFGPARDTVLTNRQTEKLNFDTNYISTTIQPIQYRIWRFTRVKISHVVCSKSANKPSTSCVRTACPKLSTNLEQAVLNL